MHFDTDGTYALLYTATDECGNTTTETREVIVGTPRTVLYTDGTFIINELPKDKANNESLHGVATKVYSPFDPNGSTAIERYEFASEPNRPWQDDKNSIKYVEIGESISPISIAYWFSNCRNLEDIDLSLLNTSNTVEMQNAFYFCRKLTSIDLSNFNTSNVTNMMSMFTYTGLTALDLSSFDTSNVTNMASMFDSCDLLTSLTISSFDTSNVTNMSSMFHEVASTNLDLSNFNTNKVTDMNNMFRSSKTTILDLSSFDTQNVTTMENMFNGCKQLKTIYANSTFDVTNVLNSSQMFYSMSKKLVGGSGTTWASSNPTNKTYAHIDGGTSDPGYFTLKTN